MNLNFIYLAVRSVTSLPTVLLARVSKQMYLSPLGSLSANKVAVACIWDLSWWQTFPKLTKNGLVVSELSKERKDMNIITDVTSQCRGKNTLSLSSSPSNFVEIDFLRGVCMCTKCYLLLWAFSIQCSLKFIWEFHEKKQQPMHAGLLERIFSGTILCKLNVLQESLATYCWDKIPNNSNVAKKSLLCFTVWGYSWSWKTSLSGRGSKHMLTFLLCWQSTEQCTPLSLAFYWCWNSYPSKWGCPCLRWSSYLN